MKVLDRLERKYGKYAIKNLMMYIVALNAVVFLFTYMDGTGELQGRLMLIPSLVLKGEVWRLVTYIFIPSTSNLVLLLFTLYIYYMIGTGLEQEWGSFRFNVYYLIGMLGTTLAAFISGSGSTGDYLNMSLFLAFAYIYPDFQLLLFFILPVKMKYLAWLDVVLLGMSFFSGGTSQKLAVIAAFLNFLLFFGKDLFYWVKNKRRSQFYKSSHKQVFGAQKTTYHKCTVCGITEKDDKNMEFRYCSGCEGQYEYCMNHLKNHEHKSKVIEVDFRKQQ